MRTKLYMVVGLVAGALLGLVLVFVKQGLSYSAATINYPPSPYFVRNPEASSPSYYMKKVTPSKNPASDKIEWVLRSKEFICNSQRGYISLDNARTSTSIYGKGTKESPYYLKQSSLLAPVGEFFYQESGALKPYYNSTGNKKVYWGGESINDRLEFEFDYKIDDRYIYAVIKPGTKVIMKYNLVTSFYGTEKEYFGSYNQAFGSTAKPKEEEMDSFDNLRLCQKSTSSSGNDLGI